MEVKKFIETVLGELQDLKENANKKRYIVQELEFEIGVVAQKSASAKTSSTIWDIIVPVTADGKYAKENIQKVRIKLKPKNPENTSSKSKA